MGGFYVTVPGCSLAEKQGLSKPSELGSEETVTCRSERAPLQTQAKHEILKAPELEETTDSV